jgi:hypothetical protein
MRTYAVFVDHHEGIIDDVDLAILDKDQRNTLSHHNGLQSRKHGQLLITFIPSQTSVILRTGSTYTRFTKSKPQPKPLAGPIPP